VEIFNERLLEMVSVHGPWVLFVFAVLETCFVAGFVVESGLATAIGAALAIDGPLELGTVLAAAASGGALGDTIGYWIGKAAGQRFLSGEGRFARAMARGQARWSGLFDRNVFFAVSLARVVPFARSVMPMAAGMSGISYRRFLPFELIGLAAWLSLYVGLGALARGSWEAATRLVGVGGALGVAVAGIALWWVLRRRQGEVGAPGADA
jgi:membrane protein DedA with SNARE-associated domain